jgi:hypothetical protein
LGLTLKITCYGVFYFHISLRIKENNLKHHMFMLKISIDNSKPQPSHLQKLTIEGAILDFSFSSKAMVHARH